MLTVAIINVPCRTIQVGVHVPSAAQVAEMQAVGGPDVDLIKAWKLKQKDEKLIEKTKETTQTLEAALGGEDKAIRLLDCHDFKWSRTYV